MKTHALLFAALADENRLRLLHLMWEGEICVCFLQGALQSSQPKLSRHLAYLRRAGLVEARREGKWMFYSLKKQPRPLQKVLEVVLNSVSNDPISKRDRERAKRIECSPARFRVPDPKKHGAGCG